MLPKKKSELGMSGTIHNPDLNIETGINQELEAELLRQREEEEERRRLENSEYNAYTRVFKWI